MGKFNALTLAATVALGGASSALAADLPPPPAFEPVPVEAVDVGSGWYLRGDVGVGIASKPDIRSTFDAGYSVPDARFETGRLSDSAFVGAGFGYQFNHWLRGDVTGEYRTSQSINATESYRLVPPASPGVNRGYDAYTGNIQSSVFLVNGYVDIGTWWGITPFIGAGVGGSYNRVYGLTDFGQGGINEGVGFAKDKSKFDLAYAAHAGLAYSVTPNLKLELAYRYLNMGDAIAAPIQCVGPSGCPHEVQKYKLEAQDIKLGMRWMFNDTLPVAPAVYAPPPPVYAPPPPLVRKY